MLDISGSNCYILFISRDKTLEDVVIVFGDNINSEKLDETHVYSNKIEFNHKKSSSTFYKSEFIIFRLDIIVMFNN